MNAMASAPANTNGSGNFTNPPITFLTVSTMIGDKVYSSSDEKLGAIKEIMLNTANGTIAYFVIDRNVLVNGERNEDTFFAIPFKALQLDKERQAFILQPKDEFKMHRGMIKIMGDRKT